MPIGPQERVLGRFVVGERLADQGDLQRWAAVDEATGAPVEVVSLRPAARIRAGAADRFRAAAAVRPGPPSLLAPIAGGEHEGVPVLVRPRATPWDADLRIDADTARKLVRWLAPAVVAAANALGGELGVEDLVVMADGRVLLAPSGLVRPDALGVPPVERAPEGAASSASALWGLGVLVFTALTGTRPVTGCTPAERARSVRAPLCARSVDPTVPEGVDALLAGLLDLDPDRRAAAVPWGEPRPVVVELPEPPPETPVTPLPAPTAGGRPDLPMPRWTVAAWLRGESRAALRRLAALAGVSVEALEAARRVSPLVPLGGGELWDDADRLRKSLRPADVRLACIETERPVSRLVGGPIILVVALVMAAALMAMMPLLGSAVTWAAGVVVIAGLLAAAGMGRSALRQVRRRRVLARGWQALGGQRVAEPDEVAAARARIVAARRELLRADLPDPVRSDLLEATDALEDALDAVAREPDTDLSERTGAIAASADDLLAAARQAALPGEDAGRWAREAAEVASARARAARAALRETGRGS